MRYSAKLDWTEPFLFFLFFLTVSFRTVGDVRLGFLWENYSSDRR